MEQQNTKDTKWYHTKNIVHHMLLSRVKNDRRAAENLVVLLLRGLFQVTNVRDKCLPRNAALILDSEPLRKLPQ